MYRLVGRLYRFWSELGDVGLRDELVDMKVVKKIWGKIRGISWMEMVEKVGKR